MADSLAATLVRWRFPFSLALLMLCAWLVVGVGQPGFATDYRIFFDEDDPALQAYEKIEREFTKSYTLLYLVEAREGDLFTPRRLAALQDLTARVWRLPRILRVNSLSNYQHTHAEGDELWVEDLLDHPADFDPQQVARVRRIVMNEPELRGKLVSDDGRVSMVVATVRLDREQDAEKRQLVAQARELAGAFESDYPDLKLRLNGQLMVDHAIAEVAERDAVQVEFNMFLALIALITWFLRSVGGTVATMAVMLGSVAAAAGLTTLLYGDFNAINSSSLYIVLMLAILDSIHVLAAYYHRLAEGRNRREAMHDSLRKNLKALFLTTLTTSVGFASMNFSASPPFREFGTVTALGVWVALGLTLSVLPALVLLFPARGRSHPPVSGLVRRLQEWFPRRQGLYLPVGLVAVALLLPAALLNEADDRLIDAFYEDEPIRESAVFAEKHLAGYSFIDFMLPAGGAGGVTEPRYLAAVDDFVDWLERQPEILHVSSFTRVIKRLSRTMHGDDPAFYRIPDDRRETAEYLLVYESSVPPELDLQDSINIDKSALRVTAYVKSLSSRELIGLKGRADDYLNGVQAVHGHSASSPALMFAYTGQENVRSMLQGCVLVAAFICLTMIVAFRSVKLGVLCMIPNLMPAILAFGLCGLFIGEINMGAAMVFTMSLGIVVDDTIHFVVSYRRQRDSGSDPQQAVHESYSLVGRAIIITSLLLCIGFVIPILFAGLKMNVMFYSLALACVIGALLADLFFLPAMLVRIERAGARA